MAITRRTVVLSAPLAAGALVSACGGPAQEVAPAAKELRRGIKLGVMVKGGFYSEPQDAGVVQPALQQWQTRTGITVDPVDVGETAFNEKLQVLMAGGTPPDLVSIGYSQDPFGILLRVNALAPLDPYMRRDKLDLNSYYPYALDHFKLKGTQWGLPQSTNPTLMFHNKDLHTRAGLQPPPASWKAPGFSWNDLVTMAQAMTTRPEDPAQTVYGVSINDGIKTPAVAIWSYGGDLFDKEFTKSTIDSPQAVDAIQMLADLIHKHRVSAPAVHNARNLFATGKIALLGRGQGIEFVDRAKQDNPNFPWGINVFPRGTAGRFSVTIGWALSLLKASRYPDEAWALATHVGGPDFLRVVAREGRGGISPLKAVQAETLASPNLVPGFKEACDMTTELRRYPVIARWNEISDIIIKQLERVWTNTASVKQVLTDIATQVNPHLQERV